MRPDSTKTLDVENTPLIQAMTYHLVAMGAWFEVVPQPNDCWSLVIKADAYGEMLRLRSTLRTAL